MDRVSAIKIYYYYYYITHSHYIAHSEPLLKQLNLLNMKDMVDQKLLKFLYKLNTNKLPAYFNTYKPYLKIINTNI